MSRYRRNRYRYNEIDPVGFLIFITIGLIGWLYNIFKENPILTTVIIVTIIITIGTVIYLLKKNKKVKQKTIKFVEANCPQCGSKLITKNGKYGAFVGCSNFPTCRYIKK